MKHQPKPNGNEIPLFFTRYMRLLEEHNKRAYAPLNPNYLSAVRDYPDILGCYSDELKALRKIAADAAKLCLDLRTDPDLAKHVVSQCPATKRIIGYAVQQPWSLTTAAVGKAPVAAEEGDLPTL